MATVSCPRAISKMHQNRVFNAGSCNIQSVSVNMKEIVRSAKMADHRHAFNRNVFQSYRSSTGPSLYSHQPTGEKIWANQFCEGPSTFNCDITWEGQGVVALNTASAFGNELCREIMVTMSPCIHQNREEPPKSSRTSLQKGHQTPPADRPPSENPYNLVFSTTGLESEVMAANPLV